MSGNTLELAPRRTLAISLFCWFPLLALSLLEGSALHGRVAIPFLFDAEVYTRFLLAIPLLLEAELIVHQRMRLIVKQFLERNLVPEDQMLRFNSAIESVVRLRNSMLAEILLFVFVYVIGILVVWRHYIAIDTVTWYVRPTDDGARFSLAGMWLSYVSLPIFQFLLCRWYFRMFIWARFLWQVSRLELSLMPTHPDRVAGLGFLSDIAYAFVPLLLAHGALLAGVLGNRIYHLGAKLPDFMLEILLLVVFLECVALGPLLVFAPQLAQAKRMGLREYGTLAERYVREFDAKWLRCGTSSNDQLVGSSDIQSLADLGNSFEVVRTMRLVPFTKQTIIQLAVGTALPIAPLLLTMMPLEDLLKKLLGIVF
ncbi:hypothetical protein KUL72_20255 [Bradyrhizobium arachidis]|uniref:hypothetical protein n=1 Tax=Bradyrhizobium arachidis TaxID=858423 RepID=UPI0021611089|nr:hypothetical protein [Bradyrhizobium arachidis]UVO33853.1 hypothetical protein KUL72_20255 [Bradyrhizobium arachidis]